MGNDIKRCIMIFPEFQNINTINEIRETYDPFVNNVSPHITLVFPFESKIKEYQLRNWMNEALKGVKPFNVELEGIIKISSDSHMTIGKFSSEEELNIAYKKIGNVKEKFFSKVDKISAEIVVENDRSIREIEINLQE